MKEYAIHEVHTLLRRLPSHLDGRDPVLRYLCALFAELAYYHVPQWEIDDKKRAKLVPCEAYQALVARGVTIRLGNYLPQLELSRWFIVEERGVIAVGTVLNRQLFIAFRGTQFLFDWKLNLRSNLIPVNGGLLRRPFILSGKFHSGFAEEAMRISRKVVDAVRDSGLDDVDHVFLTGHSLGGAVAAISENFISIAPTTVCIFGAPRYSDLSAYVSLLNGPPSQVRRPGDIVPTVPPKAFGYADHPYEFATDGAPYIDPAPYSSTLGDILRWVQFFVRRFEPHNMETYRHELGATARATNALLPLVAFERFTTI